MCSVGLCDRAEEDRNLHSSADWVYHDLDILVWDLLFVQDCLLEFQKVGCGYSDCSRLHSRIQD